MTHALHETAMEAPLFPLFFAEISIIIIMALYKIFNFQGYPVFPFQLFGTACFVLSIVIRVLDEYPLSVLDRLGIFGPEMNGGTDYYSELIQSPVQFWYTTGETIKNIQRHCYTNETTNTGFSTTKY